MALHCMSRPPFSTLQLHAARGQGTCTATPACRQHLHSCGLPVAPPSPPAYHQLRPFCESLQNLRHILLTTALQHSPRSSAQHRQQHYSFCDWHRKLVLSKLTDNLQGLAGWGMHAVRRRVACKLRKQRASTTSFRDWLAGACMADSVQWLVACNMHAAHHNTAGAQGRQVDRSTAGAQGRQLGSSTAGAQGRQLDRSTPAQGSSKFHSILAVSSERLRGGVE